MVTKGDRVKLIDEIAIQLSYAKRKRQGLGKRIDWRSRRGIVSKVVTVTDSVMVHWDDRATWDPWPMKALEKAD